MPISVGGTPRIPNYEPVLFEVPDDGAGTVVETITLNPHLEYLFKHVGKDAAGSAQTSDVFVFTPLFTGTIAATYAAASGKGTLRDKETYPIGPGIRTVRVNVAANPVLIQITPGRNFRGIF